MAMTRSDQRTQRRRAILRFLFAVGAGLARVPLRSTPAAAAGVVGTGTAASCTDAALDAAVAGGGLVTFDCGPAPVTIDISTGTGTKTISADTTIDGGGLIAISGGNHTRVFRVNSGVSFTVNHLTIANGYGASAAAIHWNGPGNVILSVAGSRGYSNLIEPPPPPVGGGILNDGTLKVTNSIFTGNRVAPAYEDGGGSAVYNTGMMTVTNSPLKKAQRAT